DDAGTTARLVHVLGASRALGEHLVRHPDHWVALCDDDLARTRAAAWGMRASLLESVGADPDAAQPVATLPDARAVDALRVHYRRLLLPLVARDLCHGEQ